MPDYRLTYFDFDGGRGEPVRIALHAAGIAFEDKRITFPEFQEVRKDVRFNALPVMHIDDAEVTQSSALCRYFGKQAGLYPEDALQALYCDESGRFQSFMVNSMLPELEVFATFFLHNCQQRMTGLRQNFRPPIKID